MITRWRLKNFKSIRDLSISFAPLTILAGPNSSGKSSIIQSILLMAQTLSSGTQMPVVPLQGRLVRLGTYDELRSTFADDRQILIEWECSSPGDSSGLKSVSYGISIDDTQVGRYNKLVFPSVKRFKLSCRLREERTALILSAAHALRTKSQERFLRALCPILLGTRPILIGGSTLV